MHTRWARVARGWFTAAVSVIVAAVSHVAGGGELPGLLGAGLALTFAVLASVALAGKTLSRLRLSVSVLVSQVAFHTLFGLGTGSASMSGHGAAHQHGAMLIDVAAASASPTPMPTESSMWLAHVVAALVTIVVLRRGERSFWALLALARTALVAVLIPLLRTACPSSLEPVRLHFVLGDRPAARDLIVVRAGRSLRGPPALA